MDGQVMIHSGVGHEDGPPGRGSGRYAWGSGENPYQHQFTFLTEVDSMKKQGLKDSEIAKALLGVKYTKKDGTDVYYTASDLKAEIAIQKSKQKQVSIAEGQAMLDKCNGNMSEAARRLGYKNESSLRSLLDPLKAERRTRYDNTADMLKKVVDEKGVVDISKSSNLYLGVTESTMNIAVAMLEKEGYTKTWVKIPQLGTNHETNVRVLARPDISYAEIQQNKFNVQPITEFTPDSGKTWWSPEFPTSVDSNRVYIRYAEDGGKEKDGVIELRRGVEDISLGEANYAQVRIAVDGTNYMKGMAIYSDDIPKGYDIVYNTNKHQGVPAIDTTAKYVLNPDTGAYDWTGKEVLKRMKIDERTMKVDQENPFGALIKSPTEKDGVITAGGQRHYTDANGKDQLSPINKLREEGDWDSWSRTLASQFLSKQTIKLINQQIDISVADKKNELSEIKNLTNPVIKKKMLEDFANSCDANASDLSVKGVKNQAFQVLLPVSSLKDNEIYAPNYQDGDTVALVRYPHGGVFEIPVLKVNNKEANARKILGNAADAVGINTHVAEQLSGADFDGDTAIVIPITSNRLKITASDPLPGLKDFDAKELYKLPDSAPKITNKTKQTQMGVVSNLITDMTVGGANVDEVERAVKHSMVVIDAEKHHLDYKQSEKDNDIISLKKTYQGVNEKTGQARGASTILSKAGAEVYINKRKEVTDTKKMTEDELKRWNEGKKVWRDTGEKKLELITDTSKMTESELQAHKSGKKVYRESSKLKQEKVHGMDVVDDATELVRDKNNDKEMAYANYANSLKSMANEARKEARSIKATPVSQEAKITYADEVASLNEKLRLAKLNSPKERQAQAIANAISSERIKSNPSMDYEHRKREQARALTQARAQVGASKYKIEITDKEWEAIQANAISTNKLTEIVNNTDQEKFKQRATPKTSNNELSAAQLNLIKAMSDSGMYTQSEIAERVGVSASTVSKAIRKS